MRLIVLCLFLFGCAESRSKLVEIIPPDSALDRGPEDTDSEAPDASRPDMRASSPDAASEDPTACRVDIELIDADTPPTRCELDADEEGPCARLAACLCVVLDQPTTDCESAVLEPGTPPTLGNYCGAGHSLELILARMDWRHSLNIKFTLSWTPACADRIAR